MILIFGLGNDEEKYLLTKHNIGRKVLDNLAQTMNSKFNKEKNYYISKILTKTNRCNLIYGSGYMNESGKIISSFLNYKKIPIKDCLIIVFQDDSDQYTGNFKLVRGGGSGGHNGINSIYKEIPEIKSYANFWRFKIGIRPQYNKEKSETFVLSTFQESDYEFMKILNTILLEKINDFEVSKFNYLQNYFHSLP
jgi:peptidyl-tRNA hydrolase, PTH1 family